jgi:hypothetical protein
VADPKDEPLPTMQLRVGAAHDTDPAPVMPTIPAEPHPATPPPPMPVDWRYAETREIARGGMGRVVEATDTLLGRTVAVKEALAHDPESMRRFARETRITARLEHPSIVPVHDAGFLPSGVPFYVMRKIGGRPLEELVGLYTTLPERLALVPHIVAAAQAVAHAHERGVVHRDIKPSNILVGELGETILIDWGLAKAIGEVDEPAAQPLVPDLEPSRRHQADGIEPDDSLKTRAGIVFGTPGFMAPEQLHGGAADERCDVYALGATLYHLLARRPPHYHKDPDKMMRLAVEGPPTPLHQVVPGVPPELETIVDKALAARTSTRYQNAGELVEDLQRFLTGRLVAAHTYTARERLVRWVRHNRALVTVSVAAAIVLIAVGVIAIQRVLDERDRADAAATAALEQKRVAEREREQVRDGYEQLTLADAHHHAETDPTRAAAMVRPLLAGKHWREARDVIASARAHGIAYGLPASPHTLSLQTSRDGMRVLAAGDDGRLFVHNLEHRTTRLVADLKLPVQARFADGERSIVAFGGTQVAIIDVASGTRREVTTSAAIDALDVSGPIAFWVDHAGGLWKLDLAGTVPIQVPLDEAVHRLAASPDGRWVAVAGRDHLLVLDRTQPSQPGKPVMAGETHALAWSADSLDLGALVGDSLIRVRFEGEPEVVFRRDVGHRSAVAVVSGGLYTAGPTGVIARPDGPARRVPGSFTLGLDEARGATVIAADPRGTLLALSDEGDHLLSSPAGKLTAVAASPASPWVVAAGDDVVLVWNLDALEPRRFTDVPTGAAFVGTSVLATYVDAPADWIDVATGTRTTLVPIAGLAAVAGAPDGQRAIVVDGTHHARLVAATGETTDVGDDIWAAAYVSGGDYVVSTGSELRLHKGGRELLLAKRGGATWLAARPDGRLAAGFPDGTLWRGSIGGDDEHVRLEAPSNAGALLNDGTVRAAVAGELRTWAPGAKTADDVGIALGPVTAVTPGLVATITTAGTLDVIDGAEKWSIASGRPFTGVQLAEGLVLATTQDALLVWHLELPATPAAAVAWLDSLTNAHTDSGPTAPLAWR